jgi:ArsR family transcriptional regulator
MTAIDPDSLAAALADSHRRAILTLLLAQGGLCVCELVAALDAPQARVSQHLARLRSAGLVRHQRVANRHHYALAEDLPGWVVAVLRGFAEGEADRTFEARLVAMPNRPPRWSEELPS